MAAFAASQLDCNAETQEVYWLPPAIRLAPLPLHPDTGRQ